MSNPTNARGQTEFFSKLPVNTRRWACLLTVPALFIFADNGFGQFGSGPGFIEPNGIAIEADGDLVVVDKDANSVVRVDPVTGDRFIVSDAETGSGPNFDSPSDIAVEADGNLVVVDFGLGGVVRVDPITGNRTILSNPSTGSEPDFLYPFRIAVDADGNLVVIDSLLEETEAAVLRVNPVTGDRTIVSGAGTGSGHDLSELRDIAVEADGNLVVVDSFFGEAAVIRVNPVSGDSSVVSDDLGTGVGQGLMFPQNIAVEADGNLVVVSIAFGRAWVSRVNPVTGDRTILSDASTGSGPPLLFPGDIAVEPNGNLVVVNSGQLLRVDPVTGNRAVLSDAPLAEDVAVGFGGLVVADSGLNSVVRVHPVSGKRTIFSGAGRGSGPDFKQPVSISVEADGNLVVVDSGLYAVVRVNRFTGKRVIVSDDTYEGSYAGPRGIAVEPSGSLMVTDYGPSPASVDWTARLVRAGPFVGTFGSTFSGFTGTYSPFEPGYLVGSGPEFSFPSGIAVEADGELVVTDSGRVFRVNSFGDGNRTILSDSSKGSGPNFVSPSDIAVEADGNLVVSDSGLGAVVRVDPITGDRMIVSDASTGSGPSWVTPESIAVEADGNLVVIAGLEEPGSRVDPALIRVDPITGDRTFIVVLEPGDMNGDGSVNSFDIQGFVQALTDPAAYKDDNGFDHDQVGDVNRDGKMNAFDIDPFVILITGRSETFTFDLPPPGGFSPLPAVFVQNGITLTATSALGRFTHSDVFSDLFAFFAFNGLTNISGGALTDFFRLTQLPGLPPETLTLDFSSDLNSFLADFGVILDSAVVPNDVPTSIRLDAFSGGTPIGHVIVAPAGGGDFYHGEIAFFAPMSSSFDRVVLTSLTSFDAGGPEFLIDNVLVNVAAEPDGNNANEPFAQLAQLVALKVPDADADGDGRSNSQELLEGTDPYDSKQVFKILRITPHTNGTEIEWSSVPGRNYAIEFSPSAEPGSWEQISESALSAGDTKSNFIDADTDRLSSVNLFYRVRAVH